MCLNSFATRYRAQKLHLRMNELSCSRPPHSNRRAAAANIDKCLMMINNASEGRSCSYQHRKVDSHSSDGACQCTADVCDLYSNVGGSIRCSDACLWWPYDSATQYLSRFFVVFSICCVVCFTSCVRAGTVL